VHLTQAVHNYLTVILIICFHGYLNPCRTKLFPFFVQEIATIADSDSRGLVLLGILLPAIGWVLFNILQPGLNQLSKMRSSKGLIGAAGLGATAASMMAVPDAEAAQEITQLAADNRPLILLFILLPAVGWVLFNILQPALNQLNKMRIGK
jgi:photosystem II PsbY protein